jgi:hypothetical protein
MSGTISFVFDKQTSITLVSLEHLLQQQLTKYKQIWNGKFVYSHMLKNYKSVYDTFTGKKNLIERDEFLDFKARGVPHVLELRSGDIVSCQAYVINLYDKYTFQKKETIEFPQDIYNVYELCDGRLAVACEYSVFCIYDQESSSFVLEKQLKNIKGDH